jgi:hypothetical protein
MNTEKLQIKWDIYLMCNFYENPNYKIIFLLNLFKKENNLTNDDIELIKRKPAKFITKKVDIYCFVATRLEKLYKILDKKELDDVLDIALWLKKSDIDTSLYVSKQTRTYLTEANKNDLTTKLSKAARDVRVQYRDNLEANSARNWSACK